jgi:hypothetical protein
LPEELLLDELVLEDELLAPARSSRTAKLVGISGLPPTYA